MNDKKSRVIAAIPAIVMSLIIFYFSAQHAEESNASSNYVVEKLNPILVKLPKVFNGVAAKIDSDMLSFIIRKLAHTLEYAIFGACIYYFWSQYQLTRKKIIGITLITGFLYACSDEFHQSFVPGRSCEFRDVLIDTNGVFIGIVVTLLVIYGVKRRKRIKRDTR